MESHARFHTHLTQTIPKINHKQQHKKHSYANMVRYGSELNISRTKATQITPKQKQVNTTQTRTHSTPCRGHAQTVITQHTAMGTQTGDTPLASNETHTATKDDIINNYWGNRRGVRQIPQTIYAKQSGCERWCSLQPTLDCISMGARD